MIHFICGKPRSGKGLLAMQRWYEHITTTQRYIVTNMAMNYAECQEYLDSRGHRIHVEERMLLLTDEQLPEFYLYREFGFVIPKCEGYDDSKSDTRMDYRGMFTDPNFRIGGVLQNADGSPTPLRGTCYILDEVQTIWPSRAWSRNSRHTPYYLQQHGKLNDMCFLTAQNLKNVDPDIYRQAQDFTYCRNHRIEKFGRFKGKDGFTANTYLSPYTGAAGQVPADPVFYRLDKKLAACYDTSAGVGMPGGSTADNSARAKGMDMRWVWVALGGGLAAFWFVMTFVLPKVTNRYLAPAIEPSRLRDVVKTPVVPVAKTDTPKPEQITPRKTVDEKEREKPEKLWLLGWAERLSPVIRAVPGNRAEMTQSVKINAYLSDGSVRTELDGDMVKRTRNYVEFRDGTRAYLRQPLPRARIPEEKPKPQPGPSGQVGKQLTYEEELAAQKAESDRIGHWGSGS